MVLAIILSNVVMILVAGLITRSISSHHFNIWIISRDFLIVVGFIVTILYASQKIHLYWFDQFANSENGSDTESQIKNRRMQFALGLLGFILLIAFIFNIDLAIAAFFAGIYVSQTTRMSKKDMVKMNALGYGLLIPIFFFAMGMEVNITHFFNLSILWQTLAILLLSFVGQVTLTAISSLLANFNLQDSIYLGIGLSACSLSGGFAVLSIGNQSGQISSSSYSIFAAVISISVLMTIIGLEIFDKIADNWDYFND